MCGNMGVFVSVSWCVKVTPSEMMSIFGQWETPKSSTMWALEMAEKRMGDLHRGYNAYSYTQEL